MIPTNRKEKYDNFVSEVKSSYIYSSNPKRWEELFYYLENENIATPIQLKVYDNWVFQGINKLIEHPDKWDLLDDRIMALLSEFWTKSAYSTSYYLLPKNTISAWISNCKASYLDLQTLHSMAGILEKSGIGKGNFGFNLIDYIYENGEITTVGQYVLQVVDKVMAVSQNIEHPYFFKLLLENDEPTLDKYLNQLIRAKPDGIQGFNNIPILLQQNSEKYEAFIAKIFNQASNISQALQVALLLDYYCPKKYDTDILQLCYEYLGTLKAVFTNQYFPFEWYRDTKTGVVEYGINVVFSKIFDIEPFDTAFNYIQNFLTECPHTAAKIIEFLYNRLGDKSLPILVESLSKNDCVDSNPENLILSYLKNHDHSKYYPQLWQLTRHNTKKKRLLVAQHLVNVQGEAAIPNAEKLLSDKKGDVRLTGGTILSLIKTEKALSILRGALNSEKNDDARDAMLEGLTGLINAEATRETIAESIAQAQIRGKLDKPLMEWLNTEGGNFPKLYWTSGEEMNKNALNFLFYRMNRTKDIRIDMEAKPLMSFIDKTSSAPFAKFLLKRYFENGADAKLKWCMTLGSILGGDDEMDVIKRKVNEWAEASRGKMAEYAVKALAMNGSTRALRAVEFFSRKYKSKNKNIGAAAIESFAITAEELGISPYDLADSIIPDFGFEGLFKEFEAGGETYRAFVGSDFKIAFLNEDNRTLKALPKGASAALKEEFKDIAKEIRDIVKSQSSRLEQYLVIQRKWSVAKWDAFFRGNPVMFAYAIRAIWGIFDEKQQIIRTFQCLEDQTLVNIEGDEFDLDDYTEGGQIGMVHPMMLTQEQINHWKDALADADVQPIFPQLDRPVILLQEADKHVKMCTEFQGIQYGGYGFVSKMEKLGWFRGSVVDAGGISSYYKDFSELGVTAIIMQVGMIGVGYYEANAELGDLMFVKSKAVSFGSYSYDEPSKSDDARLIVLGDVPPIVYSEVMADMAFFKENQIKKEAN